MAFSSSCADSHPAMKRYQPVGPVALAASCCRGRAAPGKARQAATAAVKHARWASRARSRAVIAALYIAADRVLAVADDAALAVAMARLLHDDRHGLAGGVLHGVLASDVFGEAFAPAGCFLTEEGEGVDPHRRGD